MKKYYLWMAVAGAILLLPYVVLAVVGWYFLYQQGYLLIWFGATMLTVLAAGAVGWAWSRQLRKKEAPSAKVKPSTVWPPKGYKAWDEVERIADRAKQEDLDLQDMNQIRDLVLEVLHAVAKYYHPKSGEQAVLEVPVPHVLQVLEWVCRDLREAFSQNVPGAHILTINDLHRAGRLAELGQRAYLLYRIGAFIWNPAAGVMREMTNVFSGQMMDASADQIKAWAVDYAVKRAGYYAIELYSGYVVLEDIPFTPGQTRGTTEQLQRAKATAEQQTAEPVRILIIGQVKAGKSSLINAVFRESRAAVDVVPTTSQVDPYLITSRDGLPETLLLDTGGYDDPSRTKDYLHEARQEVLKSDLVVLVSSAATAARQTDARLLSELREFFQENLDRAPPPVLVVLTNIDRLRPVREWQPPYDLQSADRPKAASIRDAVEAVGEDLQVPPDQVVPVCLAPERVYNVEEGVMPALLRCLPEAQRLKTMRCFKQFRDHEYWQRLWQQAGNSGRLLMRAGALYAGETIRRLDAVARVLDERK